MENIASPLSPYVPLAAWTLSLGEVQNFFNERLLYFNICVSKRIIVAYIVTYMCWVT